MTAPKSVHSISNSSILLVSTMIKAASRYSGSKGSYRSLALVHNHDTGASVVFGVMLGWCDVKFLDIKSISKQFFSCSAYYTCDTHSASVIVNYALNLQLKQLSLKIVHYMLNSVYVL